MRSFLTYLLATLLIAALGWSWLRGLGLHVERRNVAVGPEAEQQQALHS